MRRAINVQKSTPLPLVTLLILIQLMSVIRIGGIFSSYESYVGYSSKVDHEGDLVIEGNNVFEIRDSEYNQTGNIIVKDSATLIVENAKLILRQPTPDKYQIAFYNNSKFIASNVTITRTSDSAGIYGMFLHDNATMDINKSTFERQTVTLEGIENSTVIMRDSNIDFINIGRNTIIHIINTKANIRVYRGSQKVNIDDSRNISSIQLAFAANELADLSLVLGHISYWNLHENETVKDVGTQMTVRNSTVNRWLITSSGNASISVEDSVLDSVSSRGTASLFMKSTTVTRIISEDFSKVRVNDSSVRDVRALNFSRIWLMNTSEQARGRLYSDPDAIIYSGWYLDVDVDSKGAPVQNNTVEAIYSHNDLLAAEGLTREDGSIRFYLLEKTMKDNTTESNNAYLIRSVLDGDVEVNRIVLTGNEKIRFSFPPEIIIDESFVGDGRYDVGSSQKIGFHAKWAHNESDAVSGTIQIDDETGQSREKALDAGGWAFFNESLLTVGRRTWRVVGVDVGGVTLFNQTAAKPSMIWDRVDVQLTSNGQRRDVADTEPFKTRGIYEYDGSPFDGRINLNYSARVNSVGRYNITAVSISDQRYNLTAFTSNTLSLIFDSIKITDGGTSKQIANVRDTETVWFSAIYEYDGKDFTVEDGVLYLNNRSMTWSPIDSRWEYSATSNEAGVTEFSVTGVDDKTYGLTSIENDFGSMFVMWETPFWESTVGIITITEVIAISAFAAFIILRKRGIKLPSRFKR